MTSFCLLSGGINQEPQLYATWRTLNKQTLLVNTLATQITTSETKPSTSVIVVADATDKSESGSTLKSCQLDYQDHTLYLSPLALEMLNDDLPQLLQNLLIGVENSLERLSLNQITQIPLNGDNSYATFSASATTSTTTASSFKDEKPHYATLNGRTHLPNSPKCALRRSELITKNKLHNNKYMLRRLTNRQDSMNSTSSGNSSASGLSTASSDSDSYAKNHLNTNNSRNISTICGNNNANSCNNNNNNNVNTNGHNILKTTATTTNTSTVLPLNETKTNEQNSPALPRFCLGNSFPHIDSDEENTDDKRNSLTDGKQCNFMPFS